MRVKITTMIMVIDLVIPSNPPRYLFNYLQSPDKIKNIVKETSGRIGVKEGVIKEFLELIMILALRGYEGKFFSSTYILGDPKGLSKSLGRTLSDPFENLKSPPNILKKTDRRTFFNYSQFPGVMLINKNGDILGVGRRLKKDDSIDEMKNIIERNNGMGAIVDEEGNIGILYKDGEFLFTRRSIILNDPKKDVYLRKSDDGMYRYYVALGGDAQTIIDGSTTQVKLLREGASKGEYQKTLRNILITSFILAVKGFGKNPLGTFFILGRYRDISNYLVTLPTARYFTIRNLKINVGDWKALYPFITLDGAITVAPNGRVWGVGKYVNTSDRNYWNKRNIPIGGSKTQAASLITLKAPCVAVTVSIDGDIKVFERGNKITEFTRYIDETGPQRSRVDPYKKVKGYPFKISI